MEDSYLNVNERIQILHTWNDTQRDYPREKTLHELVADQVRRTPDSIAVTYEGESLTYIELEQRSNQLAHYLQNHGVGLEIFVGLYVKRSLEMLIGILGIMKAGGAYIPIDPDFPTARIKLILKDAQPHILVTQEELLANLDSTVPAVCFDANSQEIATQPTNPPLSDVGSKNLAYVMYTSGSTGKPKGVLVEHNSVVNLLTTIAIEPGAHPEDHFLAATTLAFDVSVLELFLPLTIGARMTVISRDVAMDGQLLGEMIEKAGITVVLATPATWHLLLLAGWEGKNDLKILVAGEAVPPDLAQALLPRCAELWNMYGPTETTVYVTGCRLFSNDKQITIGKPIANTQTYILDKNLQPVPIGAVGDLYIGGDGVARGYYNRPDLTAERFIANPFFSKYSSASPTIYLTGDRARYLEDGSIVFLGREDDQVKIRGFRIELGDVEAALVQHPAVSQNVTIAREDVPGDKRLVSYIIAEHGQAVPVAAELREYLRQLLPEYMLPAHFVTLAAFPLTPNNKINRRALPPPVQSREDSGRLFITPRNQVESTLAGLAADILNLDEVSIEDNFFDLGGNSLLAMRLIAQIRDVYQVSIAARTFFQEPTVAGLGQAIEILRLDMASEQTDPDEKGASAKGFQFEADEDQALLNKTNLTRCQFLMWMGQRTAPQVPLYNVIQAFSIHGSLQVPAFQQAFQRLVDDNDVLRTVIREVDGLPQQHVLHSVTATIDLVDFSAAADPQAAYRAWLDERKVRVLPFDQPLYDSALIRLAATHFVWYLGQHHIITDALSGDLIFKRVAATYRQILEHRQQEHPPPPQYAEHISFESDLRRTADFRQAVSYWQGLSKQTVSPTDFYGKSTADASLETVRMTLDLGQARSTRLREIAQTGSFASSSADISIFTIFATLLFATLHRINGQNTLRVGTPFHGRPTARSLEIIGLFIEMGLLQVDLDQDDTFASLAEKVLTETLAGLSHIQPGISSAATNQSYDVILNFLQPTFTEFAGLPVTYEWVHSGYIDRAQNLRVQITDFEGAGDFSLAFDMKTAIFGEHERAWLLDHFRQVVDAFISDYNQPLGAINLMSASDRQRLFVDFNDTDAPYPQDKTVVQLFEEQVERTPGAIAVAHRERTITYADLNKQANRLAHYLQAQGIGPKMAVAICMERSPDVLVAIWGILKAGATYIPIDPAYPQERIAFMLADAGPNIVLTNDEASLSDLAATTGVVITNLHALELAPYAATNPAVSAEPDQLVYIIYTSGSTGIPKGTMLTHRGLVNYTWWARRAYQGGKALDFPFYSSLAFDLTVTSLFVPLLSGGRIVVYNESDHTRGLEILAVFRDDAVDIVKLTPAHLSLVLEAEISNSRIKKLIVGGEDFKSDLAHAAHKAFGGNVAIYNEYGPTEAVVGCMIHRFDPTQDMEVSVPIGTPAANARIYLLDAYDQPVPPGIVGEIIISSDGVARGYLNRPDLTEACFGPDPFRAGARIYRTGDIGRWDERGQLRFLGRRDHQVKIRGARIELGEVEAVVTSHPLVETAVVDAIQQQRVRDEVGHCVQCGLPSNFPEADFDGHGVCADCRAYRQYQDEVARYFRIPADLRPLLQSAKEAHAANDYDCMVLLSGGKDSTYMLYQLVREYGMRPLVFSLDNGYISEQALDNVRRMCADLDVDIHIATTPHMNAIFADSLRRHSNVCDGCYKTIYTLSMNLARRHNINMIITGLARGQLFETRLADTFRARCFDPDTIDQWITDARKAYHQIDDATTQLLDVKIFANDAIFEEMQFVDFYRYIDVDLDEVYAYLEAETVWQRPDDTGRSTNCLINDAGIYIHNKERGYHNYALPYSWDVRLGHKTREMAMHELDDDLDLEEVRRMLAEVGYDEDEKLAQRVEKRLVAYYVPKGQLTPADLRAYLTARIPDYMIPSVFLELDVLPLTSNGKVDRHALPDPGVYRPDLETQYAAPTNAQEEALLEIWTAIFQLPEIGIYDNYFDLGGDSIISIQIVARARQAGLNISPTDIFENQTVAELAAQAINQTNVVTEQGFVTGDVPLTPIQHWFFEQKFEKPHHWNQSLWLDLPPDVEYVAFSSAFQHLLKHHDALRLCFHQMESGWKQILPESSAPIPVSQIDLSEFPQIERELVMRRTAATLESGLDLGRGPLVQAALFHMGSAHPTRLFITIHHLVIDGVSWRPLLEDLERAYRQIRQGLAVDLPRKSSSFRQWAEQLHTVSKSESVTRAASFWAINLANNALIAERESHTINQDTRVVSVTLNVDDTRSLLQEVSTAYNTNINDVLLTAATLAFTEDGHQEAFACTLEGHGREEDFVGQVDLSRTVGWFTSHYPVILNLSGAGDLGRALIAVKEQLRQHPDDGVSYGIARYLRSDLLKTEKLPNVLFNYMGQFEHFLPTSGFYSPVHPLQAGFGPKNQPTHALIIDLYVWKGALHAQWAYDPQRIAPDLVQTLADKFIINLEALISHCLAVKTTQFTRSDFDLVDLDDDQFDHLADILNNLGQ
jgi:amino acid adenylation domain-containing protein/non-ribosomal peptide synthase protein (TIGR01720 family)